ncbi:isoprenylcysteine carboxylmethyltransferase family protein [Corallococcus praedator]|uniref:Isoprenylcysteine carboxylmethyltransferase family protein n=1 Tax=Corallococcus praedator TaxID=2316724 RepID=A0ABX9QQC3_9BACT|nr:MULTISPECIES: isoprenylcysteine carboxylmethyltransferase family protein [Corallococcus]RKH32895.1 isoprenylcysteine carboxylmethyltransferase family protein [Corallococcus sp. CA031C]RKI13689.1 isoprenylcysteine carboxylmethyltransferase family protein [Corallococcus praedator]
MKHLHRWMPTLLMVTGLGLLVPLGLRQLSRTPEDSRVVAGLMLAAYVAWMLIESRVTLRETSKPTAERDGSTLELYAVARLTTLLLAQAFPTLEVGPGIRAGGLVCFIGAVVLRLTAIRTLGRAYSHRVRLPDASLLVTGGVYRKLRHPAYTGMLLAHVGYLFVFPSVPAIAAFTVLFVPAVLLRIRHEEKLLLGSFPGYEAYAATRKRLVPWLW